jgi:hypothetical protein
MIALATGFGGVVLGGIITFATEWLFRHRDRKSLEKKNFTLCLCETGRVYSELVGLYSALTENLPEHGPNMLSPRIRTIASNTIQTSNLGLDVLFAANSKSDEIFSDLELLFRRFNASVGTFIQINKAREAAFIRQVEAGNINAQGAQDIAQQEIDANDAQSIIEVVRIENLYRGFFRNMISDIESCAEILDRLNTISANKFAMFRWQNPPTVTLAQQFTPLEYLREMPYFGPADLPA